ncbi:hypothetical protein JOM56_015325 [Amanita muscaria]
MGIEARIPRPICCVPEFLCDMSAALTASGSLAILQHLVIHPFAYLGSITTPMNSTPNPYPSSSYHGNFGEQKGLESMTDDGAYQHATIPSGIVASSHLQLDHYRGSQQVEALMVVNAHIDAKLRELQDLYHKQQDTLARLRAFDATTTTPTWNIPLQPTTSTSSSTAPYPQSATHPRPEYNHGGKRASGYEMGEVTLEHAKKSHICHCGKGYTRKDSLRRHAAIHASENPYI